MYVQSKNLKEFCLELLTIKWADFDLNVKIPVDRYQSGLYVHTEVEECFVQECIEQKRYDILAVLFWYLSDERQHDVDLTLKILDYAPRILSDTPQFWTNRDMVIKCLSLTDIWIGSFSSFFDDEEVMNMAIMRDVFAFSKASDRIKSNPAFVIKALKIHFVIVMEFMKPFMYENKEVLLYILSQDGTFLSHIDLVRQSDSDVISTSLNQSDVAVNHVKDEVLQKNIIEYADLQSISYALSYSMILLKESRMHKIPTLHRAYNTNFHF